MQLARGGDFGHPGPTVVRFDYRVRQAGAPSREAVIDAWIAEGSTRRLPATGFEDAVRMARALVKPYRDEIHILPINWAHAVMQGADGAWYAGALVGEHRGAVAPVFADGRFFDLFAESLEVTRTDARVAAIVGAERVLDVRATGRARVVTAKPEAAPVR